MTLVDDARRLKPHSYISETLAAGYQDFCSECNQRLDQGHASGCPWLAMPRIIAALEAAERVAAEPPMIARQPGKGRSLVYRCAECRELLPKHAPDCSWQALAAAMKEPEA